MDGLTDESIWGGLGNLRFLQVTLAARGLEEHVRDSLIFAIIIIFMLFTVFTLVYVLCFENILIHDSRGFMISKSKNS